MALNVAAQANSLAGFGNVFTPRNVPDYRIGALEARQSDNRTVNLFIDALDYETEEYNYAASVVEACVSHTVYALQCTAGSNREACGRNIPAVTVTQNPTEFRVSSSVTTTTQGIEVKATLEEHCNLEGTTRATCFATVGGEAQGQKTSASATQTYTNAAELRFDVQITGGYEKLAKPTDKCTSAASGPNTRAVAFWGILGAIGAVGVLAL